jgi:Protein of unknown function (DUF4435)
MTHSSIRDLDSLADRIKLHRQSDKRGILVVEGASDERFVQRLAPDRWALFRAGTRNVVISTIEDLVALNIGRTAGLIDQDFDSIVSDIQSRGLPVYWFENADIEGFLFMTSALDDLVNELASEPKLSTYGGVDAVRKVAVSVALQVAALRICNAVSGWGVPFDEVDLSKKLDRRDLSLKRIPYCQALARACQNVVDCATLHSSLEAQLGQSHEAFFRGKDALAVVGVLLKSKIGNCGSDTTASDHLACVLRLSAPSRLIELPPFSEIASHIDAA